MCLFNYTGEVILRKDKNVEAKTFIILYTIANNTFILQLSLLLRNRALIQ